MRYATPDELQALWIDVGLKQVTVSAVTVTAGYEGFEDLWDPLESGIAPSGAYVASSPPISGRPSRPTFKSASALEAEPFRLGARAWLVTGRVP